jgi:hypothetical protein
MAAQQQGQQSDKAQRESQKRTQLNRIRWIIVAIVFLLIAVGILIWVLTSQASWITILPIVIFTALGVIIALFQWLFPISTSKSEHPLATSPMLQVSLDSPPRSLPARPTHRGIVGLPPPTDPRTIQQRQHVVKEVYTKLTQPGVTAIALTGIGGVVNPLLLPSSTVSLKSSVPLITAHSWPKLSGSPLTPLLPLPISRETFSKHWANPYLTWAI